MHQAIFGLNLSISVNFEFCQLLEDVFGTRSGISKDKHDGQGWTNQGNHKHLITLLNKQSKTLCTVYTIRISPNSLV